MFLYLVYPLGKLYMSLYPSVREADFRRGAGDALVFRTDGGVIYRHPALPGGRNGVHGRFEPLPGGRLLGVLVRLPGFLFDVLLAVLLHRLVATGATWGTGQTGARWGRLAATCWFCSRTALITSLAVRLRLATFSGSSQMRME